MPEFSPAQKKYLLQRRKEKYFVNISRILFLVFLILWEFSSRFGWIDSFIFSSPLAILKNFAEMCRVPVSVCPHRNHTC